MTITIISANYGVSGSPHDVTACVQDLARRSNRIPVNNQSMGGDPAYGRGKQLTVVYVGKDGSPHTMVENEGNTMVLPEATQGGAGLPGGFM